MEVVTFMTDPAKLDLALTLGTAAAGAPGPGATTGTAAKPPGGSR